MDGCASAVVFVWFCGEVGNVVVYASVVSGTVGVGVNGCEETGLVFSVLLCVKNTLISVCDAVLFLILLFFDLGLPGFRAFTLVLLLTIIFGFMLVLTVVCCWAICEDDDVEGSATWDEEARCAELVCACSTLEDTALTNNESLLSKIVDSLEKFFEK